MAKLVILNQGMTGRAQELNIERTTVGRVEDNTFQIVDPSVSSHHCEILLRGSDVVIRDLNSTNGTFINGEKITESPLKPGQTLRLGQVEIKLEDENAPATPKAAPGTSNPAAAPAPAKKSVDSTMVIPRGVSLDQLEQGGRPPFESTIFTKKSNKANRIFLIVGIFAGVIILVLLLYVLSLANAPHK